MTGQAAVVRRPVSAWGTAVVGVSVLLLVQSWAGTVAAVGAGAASDLGRTRWDDALYLVDRLGPYVVVLAWVVTSVWLLRVHRTATSVCPGAVRLPARWTWLGWVVPVVSLWFPKQLVDDLGRALSTLPGRRAPGPTRGWWAGWVVAYSLSNLVPRLAVSTEAGALVPVLQAGASVAVTVAFVLWVRVVRGLSAAHDGTEATTTGVPGPSAPA